VRDAELRFTQRDGKSIAYQVFGAGPRDVLVGQTWCPIDLMWELPQLASFMQTLGGMARVIVFDSLGNGASDSVTDRRAAPIETFSDSLLAVLDAARAPRVVLFDTTTGSTGVMALRVEAWGCVC
jgi:pimeloyl-ACP methyl ester carboxylesterase